MSETPTNHFSNRCKILADLWLGYRQDEEFRDFIEYNDLGLPLAYAFANDIAKETEIAERFVNESYELFAESLGVSDEDEFETLEAMLEQSTNR
jgi:DNA-binding PucR family transcriptional regulator